MKKDEDLFTKELIKKFNITNGNDLNSFMTKLKGNIVQQLLEGEMDFHLGYDKSSHLKKDSDNRRNGYGRSKEVKTKQGSVIVKTPRDKMVISNPLLCLKTKLLSITLT